MKQQNNCNVDEGEFKKRLLSKKKVKIKDEYIRASINPFKSTVTIKFSKKWKSFKDMLQFWK